MSSSDDIASIPVPGSPAKLERVPAPGLDLLRAGGRMRIPPVEDSARLVAFCQTYAGRAALFIAFALCLYPLNESWLPIAVAATACSLAGRYRLWAVSLGTAGLLFCNP